jgi:hypothetical protein
MRTFCLVLILGNALFFSWAQLIDVHVSSLERTPAVNVAPPPRIVLAKEAATTPEPAVVKDVQPPRVEPLEPAPTTQVAAATGNDPMSCTSVGPFADLADASHAQASLRTAGFSPRQRLEQGELWVGYWVSVQNLESRGAAEMAVQTLAESGIKDVYLMPSSDPPILSLGVFSDYHRAERRGQEIRALGFEPRIDDRKRAGSVYWLDVDLPEPGKSIDTSIFQTDPGKIMRLELRGCPGGSGRNG